MTDQPRSGHNAVLADFMAQMRKSMADVPGIDDFTNTAGQVVLGEMEVDDALPRMMSFFQGEQTGTVERARLIELAQSIRSRAGLVPIVLLTFSTCREVLRA